MIWGLITDGGAKLKQPGFLRNDWHLTCLLRVQLKK